MSLFSLALKSAKNRKTSLLLAMLCIAISVFLLIGIDKIRKEVKSSFLNTISQTDLIVGARSGSINLLLYSVFHIGSATNNITWDSYQNIANDKKVKWSIPLSLGDSHRNYRVIGTSADFFTHYRYASAKPLALQKGKVFSTPFEVVLGQSVASKLGYHIGDKIILSHGLVSSQFSSHKESPFVIVGILESTLTPIDSGLYVALEGLDAIHEGWSLGSYNEASKKLLKLTQSGKGAKKQPKQITAFLLGLNNKIHTFSFMREITNYKKEALLAILPGATLADLWRSIGNFEQILRAISYLVLFASITTLLIVLLSTLHLRRREMTILRCLGARYYHIFGLYLFESLLVIVMGVLFALGCFYLGIFLAKPWLASAHNLHIALTFLDSEQMFMVLFCILIGAVVSLIPGLIAYKKSLLDGLRINT